MGVELTEGEFYLVKATTTNFSTKAGVPVAAVLTINIAMGVNSQVIMEDSRVYGFAAGETHTFEFPVTVPMGTGGKAGAVVAEVFDPSGNKLANGSLDIVIGILAPPTGEILEVSWSEDGVNWHPITVSIPANTYVTYRFRVKNTGASLAAFRTGYTYYSDFMAQWYWVYSSPEISAFPGPEASVYIEPGMEGNVDWLLLSGPGIYTITFYLFADDGVGGPEGTPGDALDSITVTITVV